MADRIRKVVAERIAQYPAPDTVVYHLLDGKPEDEFQPVKCGGGIVYPPPVERIPQSEVCPDCLKGNVTMADAA